MTFAHDFCSSSVGVPFQIAGRGEAGVAVATTAFFAAGRVDRFFPHPHPTIRPIVGSGAVGVLVVGRAEVDLGQRERGAERERDGDDERPVRPRDPVVGRARLISSASANTRHVRARAEPTATGQVIHSVNLSPMRPQTLARGRSKIVSQQRMRNDR
jgi:hypothetical protein